jgi:hypothetical protein
MNGSELAEEVVELFEAMAEKHGAWTAQEKKGQYNQAPGDSITRCGVFV